MGYIYLASPYSHKDPQIVEQRYRDTLRLVAELIREKRLHIYSPILHCHELAARHDLPKDFEFWKDYNKALLEFCDERYVLKLIGWEESIGVKGEIRYVIEELGFSRIHLVDVDSLEITVLNYNEIQEQILS